MTEVKQALPDVPGDCTHRWSLRVSSHTDLLAAARSREPMFSAYSCRGKCRERFHEYVRALGFEPVEVAL